MLPTTYANWSSAVWIASARRRRWSYERRPALAEDFMVETLAAVGEIDNRIQLRVISG